MNEEIQTILRGERRKELLEEVQRERLIRKQRGGRELLGRQLAGKTGSALIRVGLRLKEFERGSKVRSKPMVFDV